jgi:iron complex transport system permease protein
VNAIDVVQPPTDVHVDAVVTVRRARRRRGTVVTAGLAGVAAALFVLTMVVGDYDIGPVQVVASLLGLGDDPAADFVVRDLRLPVAAAALGTGLALGVAGSIFQRLLGNPLASPDFVGVSSGASLFAVSMILLGGGAGLAVSASALVGAVVTAFAVYVLAFRGAVSGYRFILIGIGVQQLCTSLISYVVARADVFEAREAMTWLVGSVGRAGDTELTVLWATLVVLLPLALVLSRSLATLELGDDAAKALGVRVERSRLVLLAVSVALTAVAVAVTGPLLFVALVAGPIAHRLLGPASSGGLLAAGAVGAIVLLSADLVAQNVLPTSLPAGVVTGLLGAPYLIWLLASVNREGRGG